MKQPIIKILTRCTLHAARFFTRYTLYAARFFIIIAAAILCTKSLTIAVDPPHSSSKSVYCNSCHSVHKASGTSLTKRDSNENLCWSCHTPISNKPFQDLDQANLTTIPTTGISHRWDTSVANGAPLWNGTITLGDPNNPGGLRPAAANYLAPVPGEIQSLALNMQLRKFGNVVTCSVCHNQHGQANTPWDPYGGPFTGMKGGDSGITTADSTPTTIIDSSKSTYWTANGWINNYVKMTSGTAGNIGQIRQISGNTTVELTVSTPFPAATATGDGYEIIGRHFQRRSANLNAGVDAVNDMCEDCHYYRKAGTTGTNVRVYDGNKKSHPVVKIFSNAQGEERSAGLDGTQFNTAPLEPASANWEEQGGARYHINGGSDKNETNNIVVDSSKQIRCLSCHGIHYTDSSSGTVDEPYEP